MVRERACDCPGVLTFRNVTPWSRRWPFRSPLTGMSTLASRRWLSRAWRSPGCWPARRPGSCPAASLCSTGHHQRCSGWSRCAGRINRAWRSAMREQTGRGAAQLEHAAVFYAAEDEYLDEVLGFVGAGLDDGDLVFIAVPGPKVGL